MPRKPAEQQNRKVQWRLDFDGVDKLRLEPIVASLLDRHRGVTPHPAFLRDRSVKCVLIALILHDQLEDLYSELGVLLGRPTPFGGGSSPSRLSAPSGAHGPSERQTVVVSDSAMRRALGARECSDD